MKSINSSYCLKSYLLACLMLLVFFLSGSSFIHAQSMQDPKSFFGFTPGDDFKLVDYNRLIEYLKLLEQHSDRVSLQEIGASSMGRPMYVLSISSPENIARLEELKEMNRKLALETNLSEAEKSAIFKNGRVFVAATMSMHSSEVGPTQSVPIIAWDLATTDDSQKLRWLAETVLMIVPSHNPDGLEMIVEHYLKYLGTKDEKTSLPGVYHKYVGHNINRDFIMLTQPENQAVSKLFSHHWFPQVTVEKHQMGAAGVRYFVPPPTDPIAENIDAGLWNWIGIFGARMMQRMTADSLKGVTQNYLFDMYWPGPTETALWKNSISMLTEAANTFHATPVYVEPQEIQVYGKGLSEYKKSINMPEPWPGGWWHLRDIVNYEISSLWGMLDAAATHREEILRFRNSLTEKMARLGETTAPYYYILPGDQHDRSSMYNLVRLMHDHGVKTYTLTSDIEIGNKVYRAGDVVIPLAQPFRPFIKEVMEAQQFPVRHYSPGGEMMQPYDITSWSLPLHMGVKCYEINTPVAAIGSKLKELEAFPQVDQENYRNAWGLIFSASNNESYQLAFKALARGAEVQRATEQVSLPGYVLKPGDFVITNSSRLDGLWNEMTIAPIPISTRAIIPAKAVVMPKIGLVETYFHDMDAGWTRFIFDQHEIPYQVVRPSDLKAGVPTGVQLLIFPSSNKSILLDGQFGSPENLFFANYPSEFTKAMGKDGLAKVMTWVNNGGKIVSWEQSAKLFEGALQIDKGKDEKESFRLPFRDIASELSQSGLNVPGSILNVDLIPDHPLTYGMPSKAKVFSRAAPVFATSIPVFDMDRRIIASYTEKDILASGYAKNEDLLSQKAAMIWLKKGKGQLVLFAFNPQFRSNTHGTYKLLFNALLLE
jgi:hypothetical protein